MSATKSVKFSFDDEGLMYKGRTTRRLAISAMALLEDSEPVGD